MASAAVPPDLLFAQKASAVVKAAGMNPKTLDLEKFRDLSPVIFTKAYEAIYSEVISRNSSTKEDFISDTQAVIDNLYVKTKNPSLKTITGVDLCEGVHRAIGVLVAVLFAEGQRLWLEKTDKKEAPRESGARREKVGKGKTTVSATTVTATNITTAANAKYQHRPHSPLKERVAAAKDAYIGEREKKQIANRLAARIRNLREKAAAEEEIAIQSATLDNKDNDASLSTGASRTRGKGKRRKRSSKASKTIPDSDDILEDDAENNNDEDCDYGEDKDHNDDGGDAPSFEYDRKGRILRPSSAPAARKSKPTTPAVSRRLYDPRTFTEKMVFLKAIDDSILNTTNDKVNKENILNEISRRSEQRGDSKEVNFTYDLKSGRKIYLTPEEIERLRLRKLAAESEGANAAKGNADTDGAPSREIVVVKAPTVPVWPGTSTEQSYKDWLKKTQAAKVAGGGGKQEAPAPRARFFNAYNRLRNKDLVISVEHCHHCQHHNTTLRHDATEYTKQSDAILKALAKVVHESGAAVRLGIIRFRANVTPRSKISDENSRIGAFEIQVAYRDDTGYISPEIIHSKLAARKWPSASVVEKRLRIWLGSLPVPTMENVDDGASYSDSAIEGLGGSYPVGAGPWAETVLAESSWVYPSHGFASPVNTSFNNNEESDNATDASPNLTKKKIANVLWVYDSSNMPSVAPLGEVTTIIASNVAIHTQNSTAGAISSSHRSNASDEAPKGRRRSAQNAAKSKVGPVKEKEEQRGDRSSAQQESPELVLDHSAHNTKSPLRQEKRFVFQSSKGAIELKRDLEPLEQCDDDENAYCHEDDDFVDDYFKTNHKGATDVVEVVLSDEEMTSDASHSVVATEHSLLASSSPRPNSRPGTGQVTKSGLIGGSPRGQVTGSASTALSQNSGVVTKSDENMAFSPLQKEKKELSFSNSDNIISSTADAAGVDEGYDDEFEDPADDDDVGDKSHPDGLSHSGGSERLLSTHEVDSMQNYYASLLNGGDNDNGEDDFDF